jgi:integrase
MNAREWTVGVVDYGGRLLLRARSKAGKVKHKTAQTDKRREAAKMAAEWSAELNERGVVDDLRLSQAIERFQAGYLCFRRESTARRFQTVFNAFARLVGDPKLSALNEGTLAQFSRDYGQGVTPATLAAALRHLKAFLRWAGRQNMIGRVPHVEMPSGRSTNKAKGRPLTTEEIERILTAVPKVRKADAEVWQFLIRLLSASGLRLGEAVSLSWNPEDPVAVVERNGRLWIVIQAEAQKAGRLTECPATPEFSDLLLSVPEGQRRGRVVKLPTRRTDNVSQVVADCCKAAQVRGTAHDLRRTFGERWSKKLSAQQLQKLMRHASLQTTLTYYATGNCGLEDALFGDLGNKVGNKATDCELGK